MSTATKPRRARRQAPPPDYRTTGAVVFADGALRVSGYRGAGVVNVDRRVGDTGVWTSIGIVRVRWEGTKSRLENASLTPNLFDTWKLRNLGDAWRSAAGAA